MIISAEIINKPISGEYNEVIFDISSRWKSSYWGWVKFINDDYTEWCGEFRGEILGVEISERFNSILILTTDCLFMLDRMSNKIIDIYEGPEYEQLTLSPLEEYILASSYEIVVVTESIREPINVDISKGVSGIRFIKWQGNELSIECEDYLEYGGFLNVALNAKTHKINII